MSEEKKDADPSVENTEALDETQGHAADGSDNDDEGEDTDGHRVAARNVGV